MEIQILSANHQNFNCGLKDIDQTSDDGEYILNPDIYTQRNTNIIPQL